MKKYKYNRKFTFRAIVKFLTPIYRLLILVPTCFILLSFEVFFIDLLIQWKVMKETGVVVESCPMMGYFGMLYAHDAHFLDSNGMKCSCLSFSRRPIPVGKIVTLERSTGGGGDVRIQGTHGGVPFGLLLYMPVFFLLTCLLILAFTLFERIPIMWVLSHGIPVQAHIYDSSQDPALFVYGSRIGPIREVSLEHQLYNRYGTRIRTPKKVCRSLAFVHPNKPEVVYLWAWFDSSLQINQAQDKIDIIPEKTLTYRLLKVFRNKRQDLSD